MYVAIIVTTMIVSIDAFFVGMALKLQNNFKPRVVLLISSVIATICFSAYFVAGKLAEYINFNTSWIVGVAFLLLGIRHLFSKEKEKGNISLRTIIALGVLMSVDAVVATTVLTLEHGPSILTPVLASLGHLMFLLIGGSIARFIKTRKKAHKVFSASCLFFIAALNFLGIL